MHTPGLWEAHLTGADVSVMSGDRFIAFFEIDEQYGNSLEEVEANAVRAVTCVNACDGLSDPARALQDFRADARYLEMYREAYAANVARLSRMTERVKVLRAEVLVLREQRLRDDNDLHAHVVEQRVQDRLLAEQAVDETDALTSDLEQDWKARPDVSRFQGVDPLSLQLLAQAAEQVLAAGVTSDALAALKEALETLKRGKVTA